MINILVTGGDGQLSKCIRKLTYKIPQANFIFVSRLELDITNSLVVTSFFQNNNIQYCVNCAAYTAVDKAENDKDNAFKVNVTGVKNLAITCNKNGATLIHVSTDFVFDGNKCVAYNENDKTNPLSVYGLTKLKGEQAITEQLNNYFIIRTSWLYSEHESNFMKTMIKLSKNKETLSIVEDQIGTPTYASDLAEVIINLIASNSNQHGIYHYSNEGLASWYDFAKAIFDERKSNIKLTPIKTDEYPTPAQRPKFSVLDKTKIKSNLNITIPYWRDSLKKAIQNYNESQS
jgi:dTDP-4-dehydrorhamnose reductase